MNCYSCDQPAVNACKRCARTYCDEHGNATYCAECLQPASALPSFNLYRGALLVMLVGTAVAIFLLLRPPGGSSGAPTLSIGKVTATVTAEGGGSSTLATPTVDAPPQADGTETATGDETPGATEPAATETPEDAVEFREYVVQEGDSLFGIAEATISPGDDIVAYVDAIANLNGFTVEGAELVAGETILLPPLP
jgi:hypothetical protein